MSKCLDINDAVTELIVAMSENPDRFLVKELTMTDRVGNIVYWASNGPFHAGVYAPFEMKFGYRNGKRFHRALRKLKSVKVIQSLQSEARND